HTRWPRDWSSDVCSSDLAPAGLSVSSHSQPKSVSRNVLSHVVGVGVQVTSSPLVIVSRPLPLPKLFFQPRPSCSSGAPSGSGPRSEERRVGNECRAGVGG